MNAQEEWKRSYCFFRFFTQPRLHKELRHSLKTIRREAALERIIARQQRRIDELEKTIRESVLLPRGY